MSDDKITKERTMEHPLEEFMGIEKGTTIIEYEESLPAELVEHEQYDEKDNEIENQFQVVYDKAMDAFDAQSDITDQVEGKYAARNAEVAAQFLNTALNAAKEKGGQKQHKDKLDVAKKNVGKPNTVNNNVIMDHSEMMRLIREKAEPKDIN